MKKVIDKEMVLRAITQNLDRINGVSSGTMYGVAAKWLEDIPEVEMEE